MAISLTGCVISAGPSLCSTRSCQSKVNFGSYQKTVLGIEFLASITLVVLGVLGLSGTLSSLSLPVAKKLFYVGAINGIVAMALMAFTCTKPKAVAYSSQLLNDDDGRSAHATTSTEVIDGALLE